MPTAKSNPLPVTETLSPADQEELISAVRDAFDNETAVYPIGGGTSLDYGLPAQTEGMGLSLQNLNRVIDYPARDMTITVEAGITMQQLAETLASERQFLPIDVPHPKKATVGGVIATNWNGPRRFGQASLRDHVIGIHAVDGRGRPFKGGGRVVKNVAGYDFCKLLTGSLGTLGVITQATLRLKPLPARSAFLAARCGSLDKAEELLAALVESEISPTAIELLTGPPWKDDAAVGGLLADSAAVLVVGLEGGQGEVKWMIDTLGRLWQQQGVDHYVAIVDTDAEGLWRRLAEFPQAGQSPLVLKATMAPSYVTRFVAAVQSVDAHASAQAHAGNGVVIARFSEFPADGLSRTLVQKLVPVASRGQGNVIVLSNPSGAEMTHQSAWGGIDAPFKLMSEVKRQFDPKNILNPGRFVYVGTNSVS